MSTQLDEVNEENPLKVFNTKIDLSMYYRRPLQATEQNPVLPTSQGVVCLRRKRNSMHVGDGGRR
jgi:hypothetical protein